MKVSRYSGADARRILAAMVTDPTVCARIASRWRPEGWFGSAGENLIARWCIDHHKSYGKPPGRDIVHIYEQWAAATNGDNDGARKLIEGVLAYISSEYVANGEQLTPDYVLDLAKAHFDRVRLKALSDGLEMDLETNDLEMAHKRLELLPKIELGQTATIRPGLDYDAWVDAFDEETSRPLIDYPKDLGAFVGNEMGRDCFVAFWAESKKGKSWWLLDGGYRAAKSRHRVAFFECGDMTRRQFMRRMGMRALRRPRHTRTVAVPTGFEGGRPVFEQRELAGITAAECYREWGKLQGERDLFRLECHNSRSISIAGLDGIIRGWANEGWVADVVIIDYADLLAPPVGITEPRERINETWAGMRRMSQEYHCLVLTATQANAKFYGKKLLGRDSFADDRRKHDHVTATLGLAATDEDKEHGIIRMNFLDRRDEDFVVTRSVLVAGCLAVGCPIIRSSCG